MVYFSSAMRWSSALASIYRLAAANPVDRIRQRLLIGAGGFQRVGRADPFSSIAASTNNSLEMN